MAPHIIIPLLVALGVGALVLESGADVLRPATPVAVRPVVFDRSAAQPDAAHDEGDDGHEPVGGAGAAVQAAGWLEADPFFVAASALADGVVEEILVLEGERIERGGVVARLVDDDARLGLARAEAELQAAVAERAIAEAQLAAAQTEWDNPVERQRAVDAARAALDEAIAMLAQLPAMIEAEQARLERDQEELERARGALQQAAASDLEVIVLEKNMRAQAATVEAMRKREGVLLAQRDRLAAERAAAERNAELRITERQALDAAAATLARAQAEVMRAQVARDEAALRLERMSISAPIGGYVQQRLKAPGDKVMLGGDDPHSAHIVHLYDPERIQVRVDVPLADAAQVFPQQECEVVVEVLPDRTFRGEVTRITHEADLQKNTLQVKVRIIDPSPLLRPEMLTRVKFLPRAAGPGAGPAPAPALLVPQSAIDRGAGGDRVWVVRNRRSGVGLVRPTAITIVSTADTWASVTGDLRPGDLLAIDPTGLTDGQRVRIRDAQEDS